MDSTRAERRAWWDSTDWKDSKKGTAVFKKTRDDFVVIVWFAEYWEKARRHYVAKYGFVVKDLQLKEDCIVQDILNYEKAKEAAFDVLEEMRAERETPYSISDAVQMKTDYV